MRIVIVGNGVAGATCALRARERDPAAEITMISGESPYFFSRTALMYVYMDRMSRKELEPYERKTWAEKRVDLVQDWVVDLAHADREVTLASGKRLGFDKLVLAVGAAPNMFPWKGADAVKDGLVHFVSMQDLAACERLTPTTDHAVVVGGGLIGIELVESLRYHGKKVTFLVREQWYWPMALGEREADFVVAHMREHGVDVRLSEEMVEIQVDASGRVSGVVTDKGETIPCQMLGIAAGVHAATDRVKGFTDVPELGRGIRVNTRFETSLDDVYACGDCAEIVPDDGEPYAETIWYSAKRHGAMVADNLFGDAKAYEPPLFFNSSKFFEIEYTTVGDVMNAPRDSQTVYLKMPRRDVSVRIVHRDNRVIGFNMLGSRWDHMVLGRWIAEGRSPDDVVKRLRKAQYDVEFGRAALRRMVREDIPLFDGGEA